MGVEVKGAGITHVPHLVGAEVRVRRDEGCCREVAEKSARFPMRLPRMRLLAAGQGQGGSNSWQPDGEARVDFSVQTVITVDPNLGIDQVVDMGYAPPPPAPPPILSSL